MKCLVCDNNIKIDSLKKLFALQPLLLCSRCSQNLIPKSADVLYEDNEWMRFVIDKLNQGDIVLIEIFKNRLQRALSKKGAINSKLKIIESKQDLPGSKNYLPYPWLEILIDSIRSDSKGGCPATSVETFVVAVEKEKNTDHQVAIIG